MFIPLVIQETEDPILPLRLGTMFMISISDAVFAFAKPLKEIFLISSFKRIEVIDWRRL